MTKRVKVKCLNCGLEFSLMPSEHNKRLEQSNLPGLFHNRACLEEYRNKNRNCVGMKKRILELSMRAKNGNPIS